MEPRLKTGRNAALRLTSIKIHESLKDRAEIEFVRTKMNFQKLFNRCIDLYLNDLEFRGRIHNHTTLASSGSL